MKPIPNYNRRTVHIEGERYGKLTVIEEASPIITEGGRIARLYFCKCDCGNTKIIRMEDLRSGKTVSCGCFKKRLVKSIYYKHGKSNSRLYHTWFDMKHRCENEKNSEYKNYGGRGIAVCKEWSGENGFEAFENWALNNGYNSKLTLDRIDNDKGYSPDNCRWVTMKQQQRNRTDNKTFTYKGETKCLMEWHEITGISFGCLSYRLKKGWTPEEIIETPVGKKRGTKNE